MSDTDSSGARRDDDRGATAQDAIEAFALLGHRTRLEILLAIWEVHDLRSADNAVAFSDIFARVDSDDPGNVRYHLKQLEGPFVSQPAERGGYQLRVPAKELVRAVIAGAGVHDERLEPTPIDQRCPFCGAATVMSYREGMLFWACHACGGMTPGREFADFDPPGPLAATPFDPAGLREWTPTALWVANTIVSWRRLRSAFDGVCPDCSSPVGRRLEHCADHDPAGCDDCGLRFATTAQFRCRTCGLHDGSTPQQLAVFHPAVVSFYDDHGISTRVRSGAFEHATRVYDLVRDHDCVVLDRDPLRAAVTATLDGDAVRLTFDDSVRVVDAERTTVDAEEPPG